MKTAFYTLGCKVNQYESQAMEELFRRRGYETVSYTHLDVYKRQILFGEEPVTDLLRQDIGMDITGAFQGSILCDEIPVGKDITCAHSRRLSLIHIWIRAPYIAGLWN